MIQDGRFNRMPDVELSVDGIPAPAGSKRGFPIRRKNGSIGVAMSPASERSKPWMAIVSLAASIRCEAPLDGTLHVAMEFIMPRPKAHYTARRELKPGAPTYHEKRPDLTKLVRCVEDALKGIAWLDDSQVSVQSHSKRYGDKPGVVIRVWKI